MYLTPRDCDASWRREISWSGSVCPLAAAEPQARASVDYGCWDWEGGTSANFDTREGRRRSFIILIALVVDWESTQRPRQGLCLISGPPRRRTGPQLRSVINAVVAIGERGARALRPFTPSDRLAIS